MESSNTTNLYLYDLPKFFVTPEFLKDLIKTRTGGYEVQKEIILKECKPLPISNQASPFVTAIVRIEDTEIKRVEKAMKYFKI
jgi:hypothetical protein